MTDSDPRRDERRGFFRDLLHPVRAARAGAGAARRPGVARPPWSLPEGRFLRTCERCGACIKACPRDAITKATERMPGGEGFPVVFPNRAACDLCGACAGACPSGAIRKGMKTSEAKLGTACLDADRCVLGEGGTCSACVDACPFPGVAIVIEPRHYPHVKRAICVGCGLCVAPCPGGAIHVAPI
jgi:ferredoxin-type protein NapF